MIPYSHTQINSFDWAISMEMEFSRHVKLIVKVKNFFLKLFN